MELELEERRAISRRASKRKRAGRSASGRMMLRRKRRSGRKRKERGKEQELESLEWTRTSGDGSAIVTQAELCYISTDGQSGTIPATARNQSGTATLPAN